MIHEWGVGVMEDDPLNSKASQVTSDRFHRIFTTYMDKGYPISHVPIRLDMNVTTRRNEEVGVSFKVRYLEMTGPFSPNKETDGKLCRDIFYKITTYIEIPHPWKGNVSIEDKARRRYMDFHNSASDVYGQSMVAIIVLMHLHYKEKGEDEDP